MKVTHYALRPTCGTIPFESRACIGWGATILGLDDLRVDPELDPLAPELDDDAEFVDVVETVDAADTDDEDDAEEDAESEDEPEGDVERIV